MNKHLSLKFILIIFAITALLFSCKKNSDSKYYIKFKVNGNWVTWKNAVGELGPDLGDPSKTDFGITSQDDDNKDVLDISIQKDGTGFNTGSYASDDINYWVIVDYVKQLPSDLQWFDIRDADAGPASKYTITVSSITDKELRGSFSGNYLFDINTEEKLLVTEGEFFVPRIR